MARRLTPGLGAADYGGAVRFLTRLIDSVARLRQAKDFTTCGGKQSSVDKVVDRCASLVEAVAQQGGEGARVNSTFGMCGADDLILDLAEPHPKKGKAGDRHLQGGGREKGGPRVLRPGLGY